MTGAGFVEVADRVYVLRYPVLDVNVTLIVGEGAALLVDTLATEAQAGELADAARRVTAHPWTIVNTHHHFDHWFGNAVLAGADTAIWAHEYAAEVLREQAERVRRAAYQDYRDADPALADGVAAARLRPPTHTTRLHSDLDVGGRAVTLLHPGRGHTAGDLVVHVPDAGVLIAGDLIEEGAPPDFGDAYPLEWPEALAALLVACPAASVVVPGHGAVGDLAHVRAQHADLTALAWLIRDGHADGAPVEAVAAKAPYGPDAALPAVRRGYAELSATV